MHAPTIALLFRQKLVGNDAVDQALDLIERGNFSQAERRQQYRNLIERVSNNVALSQQAKKARQNSHISNVVQCFEGAAPTAAAQSIAEEYE